jgi:hypothetical protein
MSEPATATIDVRTEKLISLREAAGHVPPSRLGRPARPSTVWRWCRRGARLPDGSTLLLESVFLNGRWLTSVDALGRFLRRQTEAAQVAGVRPRGLAPSALTRSREGAARGR